MNKQEMMFGMLIPVESTRFFEYAGKYIESDKDIFCEVRQHEHGCMIIWDDGVTQYYLS